MNVDLTYKFGTEFILKHVFAQSYLVVNSGENRYKKMYVKKPKQPYIVRNKM